MCFASAAGPDCLRCHRHSCEQDRGSALHRAYDLLGVESTGQEFEEEHHPVPWTCFTGWFSLVWASGKVPPRNNNDNKPSALTVGQSLSLFM